MIYKIIALYCFIVLVSQSFLYAETCSETIPQGQTETCNAITQYGITWKLAENEIVGQFITGDYWVVDSGDGVTVTSVSPQYNAGKNGSMINPVPQGPQGFDSGAENFSNSAVVSFPTTLHAGDAILSSVSRLPEDSADLTGGGLGSNHIIKTVSVLTILSSPPPPGSFRPSYCDRSQKLYNLGQVDASILPQLTPPLPPTAASRHERNLERPWILFGNDWQARSIHPYDNMPSYHRFVGKALSEASMFLVTNSTEKEKTLARFIQVGIDYYYTKSADSSTWLWPVIFTGILLNEPEMYNFWVENQSFIPRSREGDKIYYIGERAEARTSTIIPKGQTWVNWKTKEGNFVAFAKQIGQEHEHLHPSEWSDTDKKNESYRANLDVDPWIGMHLSSMLIDRTHPLDIRSKFVRPQAWDYTDRWMEDGFTSSNYLDTERTYLQEMEATGFTIDHSYNSSGFSWIDAMWQAYRNYPRRLFRNVRLHTEVEP